MKSIKISLIAALAAGSFSALDASVLEQAIKGVEIGGSLRYRYDSFVPNFRDDGSGGTEYKSDLSGAQRHEPRASISAKVGLGGGFSAVGTLSYNNYDTKTDGGFGVDKLAIVDSPFNLEEAYLRYDNDFFATSLSFGRQRLNFIWTDNDNLGGSVGMKGQLTNTAVDGLTLTAFMVDSVNEDGDFVGEWDTATAVGGFASPTEALFAQNIYGAAILLDYAEAVGLSAQLWYGYLANRASLYMAGLAYELPISEAVKWGLQAQYLGNSPVSYLKGADFETALGAKVKGGNLFAIATNIEAMGFDASVGFTHYGKKDAFTFNVLEDMGDIIAAGEELQNTSGSSLHGSQGANDIVFGGVGYTIADLVRVGVDYAWGQTKIAESGGELKDKKQEVVGRLEYQHNDNLAFSAFYSYITHKSDAFVDANGEKKTQKHNNIRLEARYDF